MQESPLLLVPILLPIIFGLIILMGKEPKNRNVVVAITMTGLIVTGIFVFIVLSKANSTYTLFYITQTVPIYFKIDEVGKLFACVVTIIWIFSGIFSFEYMKQEEANKRYYGFYLIVYGILIGLDFSGNIITFYMFYEMMTLLSVPLVMHTRTRVAVMAGLKYIFYSFFGAYMVLFGIYFLNRFGNTLTFTPGGVLNMTLVNGREGFLLVVVFLMIIGFGVKAGMFPLHAWLPTAHPVAPAPASAVFSGIIVKAGALGIIRVVFYLFGADFIRGTWVQIWWMALTLITVFMGSMLAYRERVLKKRLAYSTVSQISYILFGLSVLNPVGVTGAFLHVICHAFIKCGLFLCAGAIIYKTGKVNVDDLRGIGKQMPLTIWCYTFMSLALIGIPPTGGFISKWYLAIGSLKSGIPILSWLGPTILLASALLTAGYLLPITINGFFPGEKYQDGTVGKKEPVKAMIVPIFILTILAVAVGIVPNGLIEYISQITIQIL